MITCNVFITNLGKYVEGELVGEWLELPYQEYELDGILEEIGINKHYEEYFITDYNTNLGITISEYENLNNLNNLIISLNNTGYDNDIIRLVTSEYTGDINHTIELIENGQVSLYNDVSNDLHLGMAILEEDGRLEILQKHDLDNSYDFIDHIREMEASGDTVIREYSYKTKKAIIVYQ